MTLHRIVSAVTTRITERSAISRTAYLERIAVARSLGPSRKSLPCANFAHGIAACSPADKQSLHAETAAGIAIVSAYNDLLSAHQPYHDYPDQLRDAVAASRGVAQFAGGVPAMCDGITQGRAGMELSLFSRDVIAMSTAIALAHEMFDGALLLGVCDKIVPGLVIGALAFGHLPAVFVPAGPMPSGLSNTAKSEIRQRHAEGRLGDADLLAAETASYHSPGTCTFYGTANSNQLLMEVMGLHLPGASFVSPGTPLRTALTAAAGARVVELAAQRGGSSGIGEMLDERVIVNGVVALLATGGSTNHTMHLVAIAAAAGIDLRWEDFAELSAVVPTLTRIYPNGRGDINNFHAAGGTGFLIGALLDAGLLHEDVHTVVGSGLDHYRSAPALDGHELTWRTAASISTDTTILRPVTDPFAPDGGLRILTGTLGQAVIKVSAVQPEHRVVAAPARVFDDQESFLAAFREGELYCDHVAVIRFQGPRANGMPELHKLNPVLGVLQDRGFAVALVTDGRMSGASGKVPTAVHLTPEAHAGGPLARVRDGDQLVVDAVRGVVDVLVDPLLLAARAPAQPPASGHGTGRELFSVFRDAVGPADRGASVFGVA